MRPIPFAAARLGTWILAAGSLVHAPAGAEPPPAPPAPSQDALVVTLSAAYAPDRDALWVLDREAHKLAVYRIDNAGLAVVAVRDLAADFRCVEFSNAGRRQAPAVIQMKRAAESAAARPAPPGVPAPAPTTIDLSPRPPSSLLMTKGAYETGRDVVLVTDSGSRKLAVYACDGRTLTLLHVRDLRADLVPVEYAGGPPQSPTVGEMNRATGLKPAGAAEADPKTP